MTGFNVYAISGYSCAAKIYGLKLMAYDLLIR